MRATRVQLTIDELILHGFTATDGRRLGDSFERSLRQLLSDQGVPPSAGADREVARGEMGPFDARGSEQPELTGARLAQTVYRALGRDR